MSDTHADQQIDDVIRLRRPWWRPLLDAVFGYDFFVSYHWADGGVYAAKLALKLKAEGFEVFLDHNNFADGDNWQTVGTWALRRTGEMILVGSPLASASRAVLKEVDVFGPARDAGLCRSTSTAP